MTNGDHTEPPRRQGAPTTVQELWWHLESEQSATREWRRNMRESMGAMGKKLADVELELKSMDARVSGEFSRMDARVSGEFVRKEYFDAVFYPVRTIVYGGVALILTTVLGALLYVVVRSAP